MKKVNIYTDGRHAKSKKHDISYGICMIDSSNTIKTHSGEVDVAAFFEKFGEYVSNPTAELYAAAKVLEIFRYAKNLHITIHSDFNGVQKWISKEWKAKKPYIKFLLEYIEIYMAQLKANGSQVELKWIKGHNGHQYNELADQLCTVKPHCELTAWVKDHNKSFERVNVSGEEVTFAE